MGLAEQLVANVAFVAVAVPGALRVPLGMAVVLVPFEKTLGDDAVRIALADDAVDGSAVQVVGLGAGGRLQVVGDAGGGGEAGAAEGTGHSGAAVDARVAVLAQVVLVLEVAVAVGTV